MKVEKSKRPKSKSRGGANHESRTTSHDEAYWPNEPTASQAQGRRRVGPTVASAGVWGRAGAALSSEFIPWEAREARKWWGACYPTSAHGQE
ncbi:MAG: hypothetical protein O7D91_15925, partial [Planctomycetota bacterium]|nr:hypothetical protein [Planctomycetota bacterium]